MDTSDHVLRYIGSVLVVLDAISLGFATGSEDAGAGRLSRRSGRIEDSSDDPNCEMRAPIADGEKRDLRRDSRIDLAFWAGLAGCSVALEVLP